MRKRRVTMLAGALAGALAGCAPSVDDPGNPMRLGRWSKSLRLAGLTLDDLTVERSALPFALPDLPAPETLACTEPVLKTRASADRTLHDSTRGQCTLETLDADGGTVTGTGRCTFDTHSKTTTAGGMLEMQGDQGVDAAKMLTTLKIHLHTPDGQTHELRTSYVLDWQRLGDCS